MSQFTQNLGLVIGWLLVGWLSLQGCLFTWRALRQGARWRHEYERERADFCRQVKATAQAARAAMAIPDWTGWRSFRVAAIIDETHDVKSFYFAPVDGRPLAPFAPGQYLTFRVPLEGASPLVRCYSLSDRPRQDYFRTTIKRVAAPADRPDLPTGRGSSYFHDCVEVGQVVELRAPAGTFFIDASAGNPLVLIGAGIGITPLVSMLEAIAESGRKREVFALFGFRNGQEHPFRERMMQLAEQWPQFHLHVSYSAPQTHDVLYRDFNHHGRITMEYVRSVLPSNNYHFYVCGPGQLMKSIVPALWSWGVPESHVHFEAFGPASVKSANQATRRVATTETFVVRFERSGHTLKWDGTFDSLLEFGEAAGIAMPSGCRAGSCGECMLSLKSGATRTLKQAGVSVPASKCLTCISVPAGEIVLDA